MALVALLGRPISFHPVFVGWTGSVTSALMLSQMMHWQATPDGDGWVYKSAKQWHRETGLTTRELETARRNLRRIGLLEEKRMGMPARLYYRVDMVRLAEIADVYGDGKVKDETPVSDKSAEHVTRNPQNRQPLRNTTYYSGVRGGVHGSPATFGLTGEETPKADFLDRCCIKLETHIRKARRLKRKVSRAKWRKEFLILLEEVDGDKRRLRRALDSYITPAMDEEGEKFKPQADSAAGFRKKFARIERWAKDHGVRPQRKAVVIVDGEQDWHNKGTDAVDEIPE